jgi:AraC-like DNA-binding protein
MLVSTDYLRKSTEMTSDPFSDILQLADARTVVSGGFRAGGAWAIRFPAMDKLKFSALVKGTGWLRLDGAQAPVRIDAGDVFLVSSPQPFVLAGDVDAEPVDAAAVFGGNTGGIVKLGHGDDCLQIGGFVRLDALGARLLTDVLPPLVHVKAASPDATVLRWLVDQLVHEQIAQLPGAPVASAQLAQLLFVQLLRVHLAASGPMTAGWLRALGDARIAPSLRLMHGDPGKSWRLEELAAAVAMSRTAFAARFKAVAGVPPLTYLQRWRMHVAARALRQDDTRISALALSLGYTSESAFSHAFKRTMGAAPKRYRENARNASDDDSRESATAFAPSS